MIKELKYSKIKQYSKILKTCNNKIRLSSISNFSELDLRRLLFDRIAKAFVSEDEHNSVLLFESGEEKSYRIAELSWNNEEDCRKFLNEISNCLGCTIIVERYVSDVCNIGEIFTNNFKIKKGDGYLFLASIKV